MRELARCHGIYPLGAALNCVSNIEQIHFECGAIFLRGWRK
jgi:hypothetical protein